MTQYEDLGTLLNVDKITPQSRCAALPQTSLFYAWNAGMDVIMLKGVNKMPGRD